MSERVPSPKPPGHSRRDILKIGGGLGVALGGAALGGRAWLEHERERNYRDFLHEAERRELARGVARRVAIQESAHRFRIDPRFSTFARLREAAIFPRGEIWRTTASAEAFHAVGERLGNYDETRALLEKRELTIALPASGRLLSPLEVGIQMAERSDHLERIRFIGTEINARTVETWRERLEEFVAATSALSHFETREERHPEIPHDAAVIPSRIIVRFMYTTTHQRTVAFECITELAMSGEQYIRPDVADASNLMILHDVDRRADDSLGGVNEFGTKTAGDVYTLFRESTIGVRREPRHVLLELDDREPWVTRAVGRRVFEVFGHHFGCGENHLYDGTPEERRALGVTDPSRARAVWLELDTAFLSQMRSEPDEFTRVLASLISPKELERKLHYSPQENRRALQRFIRRLLDMSHGPFRQRILELVREHVLLVQERSPFTQPDAQQCYDRYYRPILHGLARLASVG